MAEQSISNKMYNLSISQVDNVDSINVITITSKDQNKGLQINEAADYNDNYTTSKSTQENENFKIDPKTSQDNSLTALVPEIKKQYLTLDEESSESERLAGYVKAVIPPSGTVVIQMASGSRILDVGTVIFVKNCTASDELSKMYQEIGFISDVFGSVNEPMYTMELKQKSLGEFLMMDSKVFYLVNHPSTTYVSVECNSGFYTVAYQ